MAEVTVSGTVFIQAQGAVQVVIKTGREIERIILATIAGLAKFLPKPPKICFANMMAMALPTAPNGNGGR